ncbi:hypothetical protein COCC4DRAFT_155910 [Bipolaris maydis ATCC 48331]|uniref:Mid2 domain-containing protein n=2 Tax=Cochliobolus heterostrophus TaxID=5016 RepID=M2TDE4_COCH5|nr:uncharacterized protein COCC4DRAFT_155910 [Bipolaris maydis ATCC 48331]EMD95495.1 hypothetical protein COCHEDRAFT_1165614 [Bipolaris maydis C5]KAJ5065264.1 hypothetical protein J3E74DRAFT_259848 [Bipolaris maydis]ENI10358.1 hypothetical protein COCC4DRAFT_155910 [Bipolaris maydis ATCC 48331]KAJ6200476.1 hypothetical protein J3E72DRAFT_211273 [Bipolaris maydis]KAJ6213689.1 hypothetical protein PSV09DRAFT_1165614 [Bipolaris maydis]
MVGCRSLLTVLVTLAAVVKSQQCYGVDGSLLDKSYTPCNPSAKNSGCCASGDICLSNGLCMGTQGASIGVIFSRGCTDSTGKDVACPQQCSGGSSNSNSASTTAAWQLETCDSGEYCCRAANSTKSCCNNPTAPRVTSPLSATLQIPAPASTPAADSPDQEPASSSPRPTLPITSNCQEEKTHTAIVGAILGGLLGGIILGLIIAVRWMYKRERRQRRLKEHYETQMSKTNAYRKALEETVGSARPSLSLEQVVSKS